MINDKCKVSFKRDSLTGWKLIIDPTDDCKKVVVETFRKLGKYARKYLEKRLVDSNGRHVLKTITALGSGKE